VYPSEVSALVGETVNYSAAVDVNVVPSPPEEVIDSDEPKTSMVLVQCFIGAKLSPVGEGIEVNESGETDDNDWRYFPFTAAGLIEWSWDVTPKIPTDQQVRLQLRPAVKVSDGGSDEYPPTADYVSDVDVKATVTEKLNYWIDTQGKVIGAIFTALVLALVAVLASIEKVRDAVKKLFTKKAGSEPSASKTPSSQPKSQKPKPKPKPKRR
jgi:hypothetical protein